MDCRFEEPTYQTRVSRWCHVADGEAKARGEGDGPAAGCVVSGLPAVPHPHPYLSLDRHKRNMHIGGRGLAANPHGTGPS